MMLWRNYEKVWIRTSKEHRTSHFAGQQAARMRLAGRIGLLGLWNGTSGQKPLAGRWRPLARCWELSRSEIASKDRQRGVRRHSRYGRNAACPQPVGFGRIPFDIFTYPAV